ncbi:MAG: hypothetical protein [Microviridae sp.]|nr:MAG: hypothetical protein [Microviridae sp.]
MKSKSRKYKGSDTDPRPVSRDAQTNAPAMGQSRTYKDSGLRDELQRLSEVINTTVGQQQQDAISKYNELIKTYKEELQWEKLNQD